MMFTLASWTGSVERGRTPACAARWNTTSGRWRSNSEREPLGAHVHVEERELLAVAAGLDEVRDLPRRQVVDGDDAMAFGEEALRELRADEPGAPGHQDGRHVANLRLGSAAMSSEDRSPRASLAAPTVAIIARVVRAQVERRDTARASPSRSPASAHPFAQPGVRDHAAAEEDRVAPAVSFAAAIGLRDLHVHDRLLERARRRPGSETSRPAACSARR